MVKRQLIKRAVYHPYLLPITYREICHLKWQLFIQEVSNSQRTIFNLHFIVRSCLYGQ
jgi:hypothetical protein